MRYPLRDSAGDGGGGGGAGSGAAPPAKPADVPATPPASPPAPAAPAQPTQGTPGAPAAPAAGDTVSRTDYEALQRQIADRDRADAEAEEARKTKAGEHQALADQYKRERDEARDQVVTVARRAAFISEASSLGMVDAMAGYNLAHAAGLLDKVNVDKAGTTDQAAAKAAAEQALKDWPFLKNTAGGFGRGHSDTPAQAKPGKGGEGISTRERFKEGFEDPRWRDAMGGRQGR